MHRSPSAPGRVRRPEMSREERLQTVRKLDSLSTILIDAGMNTVKKYPLPSGLYLLGLLLCLFYPGYENSPHKMREFDRSIASIDFSALDSLQLQLYSAQQKLSHSRGWFFTCSTPICQANQAEVNKISSELKKLQLEADEKMASAKSSLGIFSSFGVEEARDLFWKRYSQGNAFATRQSKWDILFMGISSMGRDEKLPSFILRILFRLVMNFTIGMMGAVIAFIGSLFSLIQTYKENILTAISFFFLASLAALAFAMTWFIGLYLAAAGAVYVGAKAMASQLRLEEGAEGRRGQERMDYRPHAS